MQAAMTMEGMRDFVASVPWKCAATMAEIRHEYTLRRALPGRDAEFAAVVMFIREHGYQQQFGGRTYTYVDLDGRCYWTMGAPLEETILINRALLLEE